MAYSLDDNEANRENPFSPSPAASLSEQILYKMASLDTAVHQGFRRLDEKMDRLQSDVHDTHLEINERITKVESDLKSTNEFKRQRIDKLEARIYELETWSKVLMARVSVIIAVVIAVWTVAAPFIRNLLGIPNG